MLMAPEASIKGLPFILRGSLDLAICVDPPFNLWKRCYNGKKGTVVEDIILNPLIVLFIGVVDF